ncbi:ABC transporter permease [Bifidobacterium platyrrhinorum]|uniref:FtsX-like permease family protein n=1 Tax=Bifidobacterium platyrrhinorum TaxID=2661628 RepID=A0A6L9SRD7_9BIFI|nr:ABC transporter permease [Bifidobacterium platyrrhinorum]NEG54313.1 FtsX-like permease family protein [Bifidobacterium platyrrhinorum]
MFVLKNAWRSVVRNKGRNILIVIIVAIIAAAATIGLAIRGAAETAREDGLSSTSVTATIGVDREAMMSKAQKASSSSDSSDSSDSSGKPDVDAMREALDQSSLSLSEYEKYAKASSVSVSTYYTETTSVNATDAFQPVESTTSNEANSSGSSDSSASSDASSAGDGQGAGPGGMVGQGGGMGMDSGDFSLVGFSSDSAVAAASNGTFTMSGGKVFGYDSSSDGDVIISKALADFNGLKVGDTITVADLSGDDTTYELTIVGIYKNTTSENTGANGPMGGTSSDPDNAIYTSVSTLKKLGLSTESTGSSDSSDSSSTDSSATTQTSASRTQLSFTYVLGSKDDYETFAKDVEKAGLDDTYTVSSADVENYESSLVPLDNLARFALTLLIIVLAVGAVVLIVLNLFNVRERKYEVGVLTAIGIRKSKVAAQFVVELLIVTMIGIALGVAGGAAASVPVSNQLLAQQVSSQESQASSRQAQFGRDADMPGAPGGSSSGSSDGSSTGSRQSNSSDGSSGSSDSGSSSDTQSSQPARSGGPGGFSQAVDYVSEIDATVNLKVVGQLVLIGLALTLVSALAGIVAIIRYEPLQILADRS